MPGLARPVLFQAPEGKRAAEVLCETTEAKWRPHGGNYKLRIFLIFLVMQIVVTASANIYGELAVVLSPLQRLSSSFILASVGDGHVSGMKRLSLKVVRYPAKHTT